MLVKIAFGAEAASLVHLVGAAYQGFGASFAVETGRMHLAPYLLRFDHFPPFDGFFADLARTQSPLGICCCFGLCYGLRGQLHRA